MCLKLIILNILYIETLYCIMLYSFLGQYALMRFAIGLCDPDIDLRSYIQHNILSKCSVPNYYGLEVTLF